jgi:hypothetical protein
MEIVTDLKKKYIFPKFSTNFQVIYFLLPVQTFRFTRPELQECEYCKIILKKYGN